MLIRVRGWLGQPRAFDVGSPPPPVVACAVQLRAIGRVEVVQFLIDTGATRTVIHPFDAVRLWPDFIDHDFDADASRSSTSGVGGSADIISREAVLVFAREDGRPEGVTLDLLLARPIEPDPLTGERGNVRLPSLLGRDVLQHYTLTVSTSEVSLEREVPDE